MIIDEPKPRGAWGASVFSICLDRGACSAVPLETTRDCAAGQGGWPWEEPPAPAGGRASRAAFRRGFVGVQSKATKPQARLRPWPRYGDREVPAAAPRCRCVYVPHGHQLMQADIRTSQLSSLSALGLIVSTWMDGLDLWCAQVCIHMYSMHICACLISWDWRELLSLLVLVPPFCRFEL